MKTMGCWELCWTMAQGHSKGKVWSCAAVLCGHRYDSLLVFIQLALKCLIMTEDDSNGIERTNKTWKMPICSWKNMPNRTQQSWTLHWFSVVWCFYLPSWAVAMTLTESQKLSITRTGRRVDKSSSRICPPPVPIHRAVFFCKQIVFTLPE